MTIVYLVGIYARKIWGYLQTLCPPIPPGNDHFGNHSGMMKSVNTLRMAAWVRLKP